MSDMNPMVDMPELLEQFGGQTWISGDRVVGPITVVSMDDGGYYVADDQQRQVHVSALTTEGTSWVQEQPEPPPA